MKGSRGWTVNTKPTAPGRPADPEKVRARHRDTLAIRDSQEERKRGNHADAPGGEESSASRPWWAWRNPFEQVPREGRPRGRSPRRRWTSRRARRGVSRLTPSPSRRRRLRSVPSNHSDVVLTKRTTKTSSRGFPRDPSCRCDRSGSGRARALSTPPRPPRRRGGTRD